MKDMKIDIKTSLKIGIYTFLTSLILTAVFISIALVIKSAL